MFSVGPSCLNTLNRVGMAVETANLIPAVEIPESNALVGATGNEAVAFGMETDGPNTAGVSAERSQFSFSGDVPQPNGRVGAPGEGEASVGRKSHTDDRSRMTLETGDLADLRGRFQS